MKVLKLAVFYLAVAAALSADLTSKHYAFESTDFNYDRARLELDKPRELRNPALMTGGEAVPVFGRLLTLRSGLNTGISFSIGSGNNDAWKVVMLAAMVFIIAIVTLSKKQPFAFFLSLGFIMGGAIGNFHDRIEYHGVRDFIEIYGWPIFNLADTFIVIGAALVVLLVVLEAAADRRRKAGEAPAAADAAPTAGNGPDTAETSVSEKTPPPEGQ